MLPCILCQRATPWGCEYARIRVEENEDPGSQCADRWSHFGLLMLLRGHGKEIYAVPRLIMLAVLTLKRTFVTFSLTWLPRTYHGHFD